MNLPKQTYRYGITRQWKAKDLTYLRMRKSIYSLGNVVWQVVCCTRSREHIHILQRLHNTMISGWQSCHHKIHHANVGANPNYKYLQASTNTFSLKLNILHLESENCSQTNTFSNPKCPNSQTWPLPYFRSWNKSLMEGNKISQ